MRNYNVWGEGVKMNAEEKIRKEKIRICTRTGMSKHYASLLVDQVGEDFDPYAYLDQQRENYHPLEDRKAEPLDKRASFFRHPTVRKVALVLGYAAALLVGAMFLDNHPAQADDIAVGMKGPTHWQLDGRFFYAEKPGVRTETNTAIIKYWDDKYFGFAAPSYKWTDSPAGYENGLDSIKLGFGPRGTIKLENGNLHWMAHGVLTIPMASASGYDMAVDLLGTYLSNDKKFEADGKIEHKFTGTNESGINPADETYFGVLAGGEIAKNTRLAAGPTFLYRNGDYLLNGRAVLRYTFSPEMHIELVGDIGLDSSHIQEGHSIGLQLRRNF